MKHPMSNLINEIVVITNFPMLEILPLVYFHIYYFMIKKIRQCFVVVYLTLFKVFLNLKIITTVF